VRDRVAFGWSATRGQIARNGGSAVTSTGTYALPVAPTTLDFGRRAGGDQLMGPLERIDYYAGARADAFVQQASRQ